MDIKNLYTVIPNSEGLIALKDFLDERIVKEPQTDIPLRLAELVLTLNCISFNGNFYTQVRGVSMGTKLGPYACLFVGSVEKTFLQQSNGNTPKLYLRYIDDIFGISPTSYED
ncbi:UNVERIFIED_CONTAM: hypothetical protein FKN15_013466 [Acipenser sinensis]